MKPVRNILILLFVIILLIGGLYFVFNYEPTEDLSSNPTETQMVTMFETDKNAITKIVNDTPDAEIVCGLDVKSGDMGYPVYSEYQNLSIDADVIIDFSIPSNSKVYY